MIMKFVSSICNHFMMKTKPHHQSSYDLNEVERFLENYGGNHISHLIFLQDKQLYWTKNKQVLIAYQKVGNRAVVLGEPIGKETHIENAIEEFEEYCDTIKLSPVYYQINEKYINHYKSKNYHVFKLGEEAKVNLHDFTLAGKKGANLRNRKNKFERSGYTFEIIMPPYNATFMNSLKEISDSWLGKRKEKGFSVGFFCENYISRFPIAILKDNSGQIIAFATLASDFRHLEKTFTVDLMRYHETCEHGTMDTLFVSIFDWCRKEGYDWCSLGMSPLANVGNQRGATINEKIARFAYKYGNTFYKFKGLQEYKNKFQPMWEPKYLVYKKGPLMLLKLKLIYLIHSKKYQNQDDNTIKLKKWNSAI